MNEPSTVVPEQTPTGTPPAPQQAQVSQTPPNNLEAQPGQQQPAADPAALQAQLETQRAQFEEQLRVAQESARYHQSNADKFRNAALGALNGQQPNGQPQDPLAPYVESLTKKGYDTKQARDLAETMYAMVAPLQQQYQQGFQSLQSATLVDATMRNAYTLAPALFADPTIAGNVEQTLRGFAAQQGNLAGPDGVQFAIDAALIAKGRAEMARANGQVPPQQQQAPPQIFANGMNRPMTGYPLPQPPAGPQVTAEQANADAWFKQQLSK